MMIMSQPNLNVEKPKIVKERYSVSVPVQGCADVLHLKVWHKSPDYMCLLVGESLSASLPFLRVGETVRMNYYAVDLERPSERLETKVVNVKKTRKGRARGQYLVDLQILKSYH